MKYYIVLLFLEEAFLISKLFRYNVIVKGFAGVKITAGKAFIMLTTIWGYSVVVSSMPFFGWGGYMTEGGLMTCGYDYLSQV